MSKRKRVKAQVPAPCIPPNAPARTKPFPSKYVLAIGLMAVMALAAYSNTFHVPFQFDDEPNIVMKPSVHLTTPSLQWLGQLIQVNYRGSTRIFAYLTFASNYYFSGLNVFGYHAVNLLVHLSSGLLLFWFLLLTFDLPSLKGRYGTRGFSIALFSGLLFLCHPVQTQSVTYIVQRMTSMAAMFYLLSLVLYVKGRLSSGKNRYLLFTGMIISYLLGLSTKESTAILPVFIALYEFYFFQNLEVSPSGKRALGYAVGFVAGIGLLMVIFWGKRYLDVIIEGYPARDFTLLERVLTQFRVVLYYVTLLAWPLPSRLNLDYDFPTSHGILDPPATLASILIVACLIGYSVWVARKKPLASYFILWYFGNLLIESSVFPLEMVYEHRLYLPMIGPVVLFVVFVTGIWERVRARIGRNSEFGLPGRSGLAQAGVRSPEPGLLRRSGFAYPLLGLFSAVTVLMAWGSYERNRVWRSPITLWEDCVRKSPKKPRAYTNLGHYLIQANNIEKAMEVLQTAYRVNPQYPGAHYNLGIVYGELKQLDKALFHLEQYLRLDPKDPKGYNEIGLVKIEKKQPAEAIPFLKKGIELDPYFDKLHVNLGDAYFQTGRPEEAMDEYRKALQLNPNLPETHLKMADIYRKKGQRELAEEELSKAAEGDPSLSEAETHLLQGALHIEEGAIDEAIKELDTALKLNPNDPRVYNNLGIAYRKKQKLEEAISNYRKALDLDPSFPDARVNLAETYARKGLVNEAISELQQAIRLDPNKAEIHNNLGVIFLQKRNLDEAISSFKKALAAKSDYGEAYFNLAVACYYKKDVAAASSYARKALELGFPVDPRLLKALRISP